MSDMTTITIDRAVLEQALEALQCCHDWPGAYEECNQAVNVLREALNAPSNDASVSTDAGQAPKVDAQPLSDEQWAAMAWMHPADRTCVTTDSRAVLEAALKERA